MQNPKLYSPKGEELSSMAAVDLDILIPAGRESLTASMTAVNSALFTAAKEGVRYTFPYVGKNPDSLGLSLTSALSAIRSNATHVLFASDDVMPKPDALVRLLQHNVQVVSGLGTNKDAPPRIVLGEYNTASTEFGPLTRKVKQGEVISGSYYTNFSFLLVTVPTLVSLEKYWVSGRLSRVQRLEHGYPPLLFMDHISEKEVLTPCGWFWTALARLNIPVTVDTGCFVGRVGDMVFHPGMARGRGVWDSEEEVRDVSKTINNEEDQVSAA